MSFAAYILKKINSVPEESVPQDVAQPSQRLIRITKSGKPDGRSLARGKPKTRRRRSRSTWSTRATWLAGWNFRATAMCFGHLPNLNLKTDPLQFQKKNKFLDKFFSIDLIYKKNKLYVFKRKDLFCKEIKIKNGEKS